MCKYHQVRYLPIIEYIVSSAIANIMYPDLLSIVNMHTWANAFTNVMSVNKTGFDESISIINLSVSISGFFNITTKKRIISTVINKRDCIVVDTKCVSSIKNKTQTKIIQNSINKNFQK